MPELERPAAGAELPLTLVPWRTWAPWTAHALRPLPPAERRLAREILRFLHDRHVGIPPALAVDLARRLSAPVRTDGPWQPIARRLGQELGTGGHTPPASQGAALLAHAPPFYVTARIALPILARATEDIGERFLFTRDRGAEVHDTEAASAIAYGAHEQKLSAFLARVAGASGIWDSFWMQRATALRELVGARSASRLPDLGALEVTTLRRIGRSTRPPRSRGRAAPEPGNASTGRSRLRVADGGVEDIAISRSPEDLPRMLMSAWLEPRFMRLMRLALNSGVPVLDRPPLREKPRHVLLVGVMPELPPTQLTRGLVKVAWLDAMLLACSVLRERGLPESEIRWMESDGLGGCRRFSARLSEIETLIPRPEELASSLEVRHQALELLGWLPALFDRHARPVGEALEPDGDEPWAWARAAAEAGADATPIEDFRAVHLIGCMAAARPETDAVAAAGFRRALGFHRASQAFCTVTRVPEEIDDIAGWGQALAGHEAPPDQAIEKWLVGRIQATWMHDLAKVIS